VIDWRIQRYGTVSSTMDVAAGLASEGAPEGTVVVAEEQTAGRGRAGRAWTAGPGESLQATAILRPGVPPARLTTLPLLTGLAAAEAVDLATGARCWLKWPNDLWLGDRHLGRKAGGILVEAKADGAVLVGIGINLGQRHGHLPDGATSLAIEGALTGRDFLLEALLGRLAERYREFLAADSRDGLDAWLERAALLGQRVTVDQGESRLEGVLAGVRDDGALLLETGSGDRVPVVVGDLSRGPRLAGAPPRPAAPAG